MKSRLYYYILGLFLITLPQSTSAQSGTIATPVNLELLKNESRDISQSMVYDLSLNKQITHFTFSIEKPSTVVFRHRLPMDNRPSEILLNSSVRSDDENGRAYLIEDLGAGEHCFTSYFKDGNPGLITSSILVNEVGSSSTPNYSNHKNYILSRTYTSPYSANYQDIVQYIDGLGRVEQTIHQGITQSGKDLVYIHEYDEYGRQSIGWLPGLSSNNGAFNSQLDIKESAKSVLANNDTRPYSVANYENSPLNRILEQYGPGQDWHTEGKSVKTSFIFNRSEDVNLNCTLYKAEGTNSAPTLRQISNYPNGQLNVITINDEDGNLNYTFKDKLGRLILTRQVSSGVKLDTYYVYNDFGNLCFVLPPRINDEGIAQNKLNELAYQYKYDSRNRCIAKKMPGADWLYLVYDLADRVIFIQDGNMRVKGEWQFSICDVFGRDALKGTCKNNIDYLSDPLSDVIVKATWVGLENTLKGYDVSGTTLTGKIDNLVVNYYDNYEFLLLTGYSGLDYVAPTTDYDTRYAGGYNGMLTGTYAAGTDNTPFNNCSALYYDSRGRLVQSQSTNHLGGKESYYIRNNFVGQPLKRMHIHTAPDKVTQSEYYTYTYDHAGRLITTAYKLNTGLETLLTDYEYDELGRLKSNKRNGRVELKSDYAYNVRSWMKGITGTLFSQSLYYNDKRSSNTNEVRYNGNISGMDWIADSKNRGYDFSYDALSRLTGAEYFEGGARSDKFDTSYSYDNHGNMLKLTRRGNVGTTTYNTVDNLTMNYIGNQLVKMEDTGSTPSLSMSMDFKNGASQEIEYSYDSSGNMVKDLNKGMSSIEYNVLNLPQKVTFTGVNNPVNEYVYSAAGKKLAVIHKSSTVKRTDYVGNIIYENGALKRILIDGGYIEDGIYHFFLQDHLGNNRVVAKADGTVVQTNHFYPYGMSFAEGTQTSNQSYRYNGKELDTEYGLNLYDYEARQMEVTTGRFTTIDPLSEKYYSVSPYVYCVNNPVKYVDPDGKKIVIGTFWQRVMGALGLNSYIYKVSEHFMQNNMDNRRIESVYYQLEKSDFTYHVLPLSESPVKNPQSVGNHVIPDSDVERGKKQGGTLYYDPEMKETPSGDVRNPRIALAHETGHLEDLMNGKTVPTNRKEAFKGNKVELYKMELNEQNSLELENIIRAILNYEKRDEYFKTKK